jgi:hypothetical protein
VVKLLVPGYLRCHTAAGRAGTASKNWLPHGCYPGLTGSVFIAPRMFMAAKATWRAIKAGALECRPQTTHSALLTKKSQKPALRLRSVTRRPATTR